MSEDERPEAPRLKAIVREYEALPADLRAAVAMSIAKGLLLRAVHECQLAPVIAGLLELQGIVVVIADEVGPKLESTSHDDAPAVCKELIKALHKRMADAIDAVCEPRVLP